MGIFTRFLRRSKAAEEAPTAEATEQGTTSTAAEVAAEGPEETKGSDEAKGSPETAGPEAEAEGDACDRARAEESSASDDVEIPQQQTAEKAADNEAGEGARK